MQHKRKSVSSLRKALKEAYGDNVVVTIFSPILLHVRVSKFLTLHEVYQYIDHVSVDFGFNPKIFIQHF